MQLFLIAKLTPPLDSRTTGRGVVENFCSLLRHYILADFQNSLYPCTQETLIHFQLQTPLDCHVAQTFESVDEISVLPLKNSIEQELSCHFFKKIPLSLEIVKIQLWQSLKLKEPRH